MLISHNWLKSYYTNPEKVPAPKQVAELFTMHAFEVESMEEKGDDTIYDIKITPDRAPYAYGVRFVALELSLLVPELEMLPAVLELTKTNIDLSNISSTTGEALVDEDAKDGCSMYSLTKIENVQNGLAPEWLKTRLESIDQQSRGVVVDLTNFVMFDTGQPLHAFDADKVEGQIHVGRSKEGERVTILGGKEIALAVGTLVIRDDKDILAIAGVKGGIKAEVDVNTKNIYLESANFNQVQVRRTARSLNLLNDSSKRFEQGLTPERFLSGRKTYVYFLNKEQPEAKVSDVVVSSDISVIADESKLRKIIVDVSTASISINKEDPKVPAELKSFLENILPKTGAKVEKQDENTYVVTQPHYRADLVSQADVVDEFLRNKGYDFLVYAEPAKRDLLMEVEDKNKLVVVIRDFFINQGFYEIKLHTLVSKKKDTKSVLLANSLNEDRSSLRSTLNNTNFQFSLGYNQMHLDIVGKTQVGLFEIGNVFKDLGNDVEELTQLQFGTLAYNKQPKVAEKWCKDVSADLGNLLGVQISENQNIYIEELLQQIDTNKLNQLYSQIIPYQAPKTIAYKKASIYPAMSRDIAFFGSQDQNQVAEFIKTQVEKYSLIENYFCFDVFSKEDKTSYAYRFVFQSYEKTLTEEEVGVFMNEIAAAVTAAGWTVR